MLVTAELDTPRFPPSPLHYQGLENLPKHLSSKPTNSLPLPNNTCLSLSISLNSLASLARRTLHIVNIPNVPSVLSVLSILKILNTSRLHFSRCTNMLSTARTSPRRNRRRSTLMLGQKEFDLVFSHEEGVDTRARGSAGGVDMHVQVEWFSVRYIVVL